MKFLVRCWNPQVPSQRYKPPLLNICPPYSNLSVAGQILFGVTLISNLGIYGMHVALDYRLPLKQVKYNLSFISVISLFSSTIIDKERYYTIRLTSRIYRDAFRNHPKSSGCIMCIFPAKIFGKIDLVASLLLYLSLNLFHCPPIGNGPHKMIDKPHIPRH